MKNTKLKKNWILITLTILLLFFSYTYAQSESLTLKLNRDFGYGGFNGDIQGRFSMKVTNNPSGQELVSVTYFIDDQEMATLTESPFHLQFNTDIFDPGWHTLSAQGTLADGTLIGSNQFKREFVEKGKAWDSMKNIVIPVLAISVLLAIVGPILSAKQNKNFELGVYGVKGGAVCKKCHLPFARNMWSPNMGLGKLEKCPHCGKRQITMPASSEKLRAAEELYRSENDLNFTSTESEEDKLKKMIENSKFDH